MRGEEIWVKTKYIKYYYTDLGIYVSPALPFYLLFIFIYVKT